jgi:hypothetical protein
LGKENKQNSFNRSIDNRFSTSNRFVSKNFIAFTHEPLSLSFSVIFFFHWTLMWENTVHKTYFQRNSRDQKKYCVSSRPESRGALVNPLKLRIFFWQIDWQYTKRYHLKIQKFTLYLWIVKTFKKTFFFKVTSLKKYILPSDSHLGMIFFSLSLWFIRSP